jgi:hypothetical protein
MKWFLIIAAAFAILMFIIVLLGSILPRNHVATRSAYFHRSPVELYAAIYEIDSALTWRTDISQVETLAPRARHRCFRETTKHGKVTYLVVAEQAPEKLILKIADDNLPYGGTWTYDLIPKGSGTVLQITERGEIKNVIFRCLARFVFGYTASMETRLSDLGRKFGELTVVSPE